MLTLITVMIPLLSSPLVSSRLLPSPLFSVLFVFLICRTSETPNLDYQADKPALFSTISKCNENEMHDYKHPRQQYNHHSKHRHCWLDIRYTNPWKQQKKTRRENRNRNRNRNRIDRRVKEGECENRIIRLV